VELLTTDKLDDIQLFASMHTICKKDTLHMAEFDIEFLGIFMMCLPPYKISHALFLWHSA
jgi:hypothetical protein